MANRKRLCEGCGKEKASVAKETGLCTRCRGLELQSIGKRVKRLLGKGEFLYVER